MSCLAAVLTQQNELASAEALYRRQVIPVDFLPPSPPTSPTKAFMSHLSPDGADTS